MIELYTDRYIIKNDYLGFLNFYKIDHILKEYTWFSKMDISFISDKITFVGTTEVHFGFAYIDNSVQTFRFYNLDGTFSKKLSLSRFMKPVYLYQHHNQLFLRVLLSKNNKVLIFDINIDSENSVLIYTLSYSKILDKNRMNLVILQNDHQYTFNLVSLKLLSNDFDYTKFNVLYSNFDFKVYSDNKNNIIFKTKHLTIVSKIEGQINWIKSVGKNLFLFNTFKNGNPEYTIYDASSNNYYNIIVKGFSINFLKYNESLKKFVLCIENYNTDIIFMYYDNIEDINEVTSTTLNVEHLELNDETYIYYNKIMNKSAYSDESKVLIYLHGGPNSTDLNMYNPLISEFLSMNYIVYSINYYGSTLFGESYMKKIQGDWFNSEVEQIITFIEHLIFDQEKKVVLVGESYGSILSVFVGDRLINKIDSIIAISPILNLGRLLTFKKTYIENFSNDKVQKYNNCLVQLLNSFNGDLLFIYGEKDKFITSSDVQKFLNRFPQDKYDNFHLRVNKTSGHYFYSKDDIEYIKNIVN